jgi:hypothetical protein
MPYVCMYVRMYVRIYIHTHTNTHIYITGSRADVQCRISLGVLKQLLFDVVLLLSRANAYRVHVHLGPAFWPQAVHIASFRVRQDSRRD